MRILLAMCGHNTLVGGRGDLPLTTARTYLKNEGGKSRE